MYEIRYAEGVKSFWIKPATIEPFFSTVPLENKLTIFKKALPAGAAVIVGSDANGRVQHAVPPMNVECGISGSIVGRSIKTIVPWDQVDKEIGNRM